MLRKAWTQKRFILEQATSQRFAHLDALRAISVLLVLVAHAGLGDLVPGGSGVTLFFCISGFVITNLVIKEYSATGNFNLGSFYKKRALKILPPLALIVILPSVIFAGPFQISGWDVLAQVLFYFNWIYMTGQEHILPGSGVVWSLSIEEQFYILFSVMWYIIARSRLSLRWLASVSVLAVVYANVSRFYFAGGLEAHNRVYYGSDTRMDAIALGVVAAIWLSKRQANSQTQRSTAKKNKIWDISLCVALALFVVSLVIRDEWFRNSLRFTMQSACAIVFILYGFRTTSSGLYRRVVRFTSWGPIRFIGIASYSIYLSHLIVFDALGPLLAPIPLALSIFVKVAVGILIGSICYLAIEVPFLELRQRLVPTSVSS